MRERGSLIPWSGIGSFPKRNVTYNLTSPAKTGFRLLLGGWDSAFRLDSKQLGLAVHLVPFEKVRLGGLQRRIRDPLPQNKCGVPLPKRGTKYPGPPDSALRRNDAKKRPVGYHSVLCVRACSRISRKRSPARLISFSWALGSGQNRTS